MTIEHYIIAKLAEVMYTVGENQPERRAVGCMIRNQVSGGNRWDQTVRYWDNCVPNPYDPTFIQTLWDAEEIFYNRMADMIDGATKYTLKPCLESVKIGRFYFKVESRVSCDLPVQIDSPHDLET